MNRVKLRENTFKLLYCNDFHNRSEMPKQYDLFWEETPEVSEEDRKFISNRVDTIAEKIDEIDEAINKAAVKWTTDRMSKVDLTILRLAYYEMKTTAYYNSYKKPYALTKAVKAFNYSSVCNGLDYCRKNLNRR